ncbi:LysM peptidoglycan-binding domain-containing protein [Actinomycetospora sp. NBC_00405]|uniref:LysM peptidoglycan-binding domain-containing protein n=1 Tax=Actinomycetospora sp. NBC_00405 TaxID=2975952 RepID=UPI002E2054BE
MSVGTTGARDRRDAEVSGQGTGPAGPAAPVGRSAARPQPAGTRPARPEDARGPVRPAGRRGPAVLPPVRPRVAGGGATPARPARALEAPVAPAVLRRRRIVAVAVLGVVLGVLLGVLVGFVVPLVGAAAPVPSGTTVTVVGSGESLSDVAGRIAPGSDADAVVGRIRELNELDGSSLAPGRPLVVPAPAAAG